DKQNASAAVRTFDKLYIGGEWVSPSGGEKIEIISPSTELVVGHVPNADAADIDRAVNAAKEALFDPSWGGLSPAERADVLYRVADELEYRVDALAASF